MKKKLILSAVLITIGSIVCIAINQVRKQRNGGKNKVFQNRTDNANAFMMDTFEPIEDFEMIYFDEQRGLVEIKTTAK
jgi:hypothetical protein